jgi:hypothetical protein
LSLADHDGDLFHRLLLRAALAYDRSDRLELRRLVMAAWANYVCGADDSNVIPLRTHERA